MSTCAACAGPVSPADPRPTIRADQQVYHVTCAPRALLETASEEYRAIVRKGVRYFVGKYTELAVEDRDLGTRFLELGRELEAERLRRDRA
jgi:hypothetical protein